MANNRNFVQGQDYQLSGSGVIAAATTVRLSSFKTPDGTNITMADFGTLGYGTFEPETEREENMSFTGITQNADGTADLTGVVRGLGFVPPYTAVAALDRAHAGGTTFRISNSAPFYNDQASKENDNTFSQSNTFQGPVTFTDPNIPQMDVYTAPTLDVELAAKKYVDDTAVAGAPDAAEGTKGIVELATNAEMGADPGTSTGSTGARLVPPNDQLITTSAGAGDANKLAVLAADGKFDSSVLRGESTVTYTAAEDVATNVPVSKNSTADEIVNYFAAGLGNNAVWDSGAVDCISATRVNDTTVAVVYREGGLTMDIVAGTIVGNEITWGTPQELQASGGNTDLDIATVATNKVAVVYTDGAASNEGKCIVATLSGTVFTVGSAVQYSSGTNDATHSSVCQIDSDKLLVSWYDAVSTDGKAAAATISGTVPTFGSEVVYEADVVVRTSCCQLDTDKALIVWGDDTNAQGEGRVATVSGTVVSFSAAAVVFEAGGLPFQPSCAQLTTDKAIVTWVESNEALARVATISGSTPSYGTEETISLGITVEALDGVRTVSALSATLAVMVYTTTAETYYNTITISGTTATAGAQNPTGRGDGDFLAVAAMNDADRFLYAFDDDGNTSDGTGFMVALTGNADSYVGITTAAALATASVVVQREGLLTGFTGLTIGAAFYAESNGVTSTKTETFVGVAKDTDEMDLSSSDPSKLAESETRFQRLQTSRAAATVSGTEILKFNFTPSMIVFHGMGDDGTQTGCPSHGTFISLTDQGCSFTNGTGVGALDTTNVIVSDVNGTNFQKATVTAISGGDVTLSWTQGGTGNATFVEINAYK